MKLFLASLLFMMAGCIAIPEGLSVVEGFELDRYLGKWYEIARLDHRFERGLTNITAEYSMREDGGITVINSGYNAETGERKMAEGKAYFTGSAEVGNLKVSFFDPFYGGYNIIALDREHYRYALIAGPDRDYLWILSRTPTLPNNILQKLVDQARQSGFATDQLIYTEQQP